MSSVVKTVSKAFRKIVPKAIKDVANKVWDNKIARMAIIAAAVWFTAGTASAYFAAPSAGLGSAMSASGTAMWQTATTGSFVSGANVATGASATSGSQAAMLASQTAEFGTAGTASTNVALGTTAGTEAGVGTMGGLTAEAGSQGIIAGATEGAVTDAGTNVAAKEGMSGTQKFALTMMGGQALQGAMASKDAQKERERQDAIRRERGTYGFDYEGKPSGGLVRGAMAQESQTIQGPAGQAAQRVRQVKQKDLAKLNNQGLINNNRRY